jgi:hypothetical protein
VAPPKEEAGDVAKRQEVLYEELAALLEDKTVAIRMAAAGESTKHNRLHLLSTLIDPWSLTQSVENCFYFSILLQEHKARVQVGKDGEAYIAVGGLGSGDGGRQGAAKDARNEAGVATSLGAGSRQLVLDMDESLWRAAISAYGLKKPLLTHRDSTDSTAPASFEGTVQYATGEPMKRRRTTTPNVATALAMAAAAAGSEDDDDQEEEDEQEEVPATSKRTRVARR